ncbi:MAG: TraR/DksA C4-type zinc finger protein [Acidimicrobiia bacterium]
MARTLAESTVAKLREALEEERAKLIHQIEEHERELEEALQSESPSERIPDPTTAEGGTLSFEYEMARELDEAAADRVRQIDHAMRRMDAGTYGICESCGEDIPVERLRFMPHVTLCVDCARKRR